MICSYCGKELTPGDQFCIYCGNPVRTQPAPKPVVWAEPEDPTTWAEPEEPVTWAEPEEPVTWAEPEKPVTWAEPEKPVTWAEPEKPVTWAEPEKPVTWAEPEEPVTWAEPEDPTTWAEPEDPTTWAEPEEPAAPSGWAEPIMPTGAPKGKENILSSFGANLKSPDTGVSVKPSVKIPTTPPKQTKKKRTPPPGIRLVLRILSVLLCICLMVCLMATAIVLDAQRLMEQKNMETVVDSVLQSGPALTPVTLARDFNWDPNIKLDQNQIIDWVYETLEENSQQAMKFSQDQLTQFLEQSTTGEFVSEKVSGFVGDFLNGTQNTTLTADEVIGLLEENAAVIEEVFGEKVDAKMKREVRDYFEENDIQGMIQTEIFGRLGSMKLVNGLTLSELMQKLRQTVSPAALTSLIAMDILLIVLLLLTNWLRIGSTLRCTGISATLAGGVLSVPTLLLQLVPSALDTLGAGVLAKPIQALLAVIAPVHYTLLGVGVVLIVVGIIVNGMTNLSRA